MEDEQPITWRQRSMRPFSSGQTPAWMNGVFYPLVVAVLCAVVVVLQGLREDMVVIKVKVGAVERWVEGQQEAERQRARDLRALPAWSAPDRVVRP